MLDDDLKCDSEDPNFSFLIVNSTEHSSDDNDNYEDENDEEAINNQQQQLNLPTTTDSSTSTSLPIRMKLNRPSIRKSYFLYIMIVVLLIGLILIFALTIFYKFNRFKSRVAARKRSKKYSSAKFSLSKTGAHNNGANANANNNSSYPFEFFNLFNKPNSSEYDFYFNADNKCGGGGQSAERNVGGHVSTDKTGSCLLTMSEQDLQKHATSSGVDSNGHLNNLAIDLPPTSAEEEEEDEDKGGENADQQAVQTNKSMVDGDTRSEYSITDYERMNYVQEWINSISLFRFIRVNSVNTNNSNNDSSLKVSTYNDQKGRTYQTIEF
jgi:hypothetical protein